MTRRVLLSDEAYRRLRSSKKPGETFSDVVLRLTSRRSLDDLEGSMTATEASRVARWIRTGDAKDRA